MLAGDPATAERYLRIEFDSFSQMGERRFLATTAATWPGPSRRKGRTGTTRPLELIAMSQEAAADEDLSALAIGREPARANSR